MKVDLNDVIECLEHEGEHLTHYYNKDTGIIIYVEDEATSSYSYHDYERLNEFEEWEQELISMLYDYKNNNHNYIQLPSINELDEYNLMTEFCTTINNEVLRDELLKLAKSSRDIRKLREKIEDANLSIDWFEYREAAEKEIAIKWCNDNNISIS